MIQPPEDECANMLPHVQQLYLFNNSVCDCLLKHIIISAIFKSPTRPSTSLLFIQQVKSYI